MIETACGVALLLPLWSALASPAIPLGLRAGLVVLWFTAALRPHIALVVLALIVPFGSVLPTWIDAAPLRYTEAILVAALSGTFVAAARPTRSALRPQAPSLGPPAAAVACLVGCSASLSVFARPASRLIGVGNGALLLGGLALAFVVARHARDGVMRPVQLLQSMAAAGAGAALFVLVWTRPLAPGAAGPYFALTAGMGLALALHHTRDSRPGRRWPVLVASALVAAGLAIAVSSLDPVSSPSRGVSPIFDLRAASALTALTVLGLVWLLATGVIRIARGLRSSPSDLLLMGAAAALAGFVVAWTTSLPLLVPEAAYPFWMLCGIAIARADGDAQLPHGSPLRRG